MRVDWFGGGWARRARKVVRGPGILGRGGSGARVGWSGGLGILGRGGCTKVDNLYCPQRRDSGLKPKNDSKNAPARC